MWSTGRYSAFALGPRAFERTFEKYKPFVQYRVDSRDTAGAKERIFGNYMGMPGAEGVNDSTVCDRIRDDTSGIPNVV